jgi:two-component system LytT family response regulator
VKPVTLKRLSEALDRARKRVSTSLPSYPPQLIEQLRKAVCGTQASEPRRLLVRDGRGHRLLQVELIHSFIARAGEVYTTTARKEYMVDYTLTEFESRFSPAFARASRADLVSMTHVEKFFSDPDGTARLTLSDGTEVRVSRRRTAEIGRRFEQLA